MQDLVNSVKSELEERYPDENAQKIKKIAMY